MTSRYYGEPGRQMDMVAVTGTNGKTSVSYMVESVLRISEGARVGVIGTAGSRIGDELIPMPRSVLTTPESPDLQYLLGRMRDRGVASVVLEATSMALLTHRVDRSFIDVGVFTNLTQDHLDDHGTMENYRDAKLRLFQGLCRRAVVNADDPVGAGIQAMMPGAVTTYALDAEADYRATDLTVDAVRHALHPAPRRPQVPGGDPRTGPVLGGQRPGHRGGLPRPGARPGRAGRRARPDAADPRPVRTLRDPGRHVRDRGLRPLPGLPGARS